MFIVFKICRLSSENTIIVARFSESKAILAGRAERHWKERHTMFQPSLRGVRLRFLDKEILPLVVIADGKQALIGQPKMGRKVL